MVQKIVQKIVQKMVQKIVQSIFYPMPDKNCFTNLITWKRTHRKLKNGNYFQVSNQFVSLVLKLSAGGIRVEEKYYQHWNSRNSTDCDLVVFKTSVGMISKFFLFPANSPRWLLFSVDGSNSSLHAARVSQWKCFRIWQLLFRVNSVN